MTELWLYVRSEPASKNGFCVTFPNAAAKRLMGFTRDASRKLPTMSMRK